MEVIALVGSSGTGKSHRALIVAHKNEIDAIIDDGLLIKDNKIIAGHSAKKEKSKIQAVKRAIFSQKSHALEVSNAIEKIKPKKILILGTSENMVHKIAKVLDIPQAGQIIKIEDVATEAEISKALETRLREGKHIIPVPTIELKPHFSGYLIDPLEIFFKKSSNKQQTPWGRLGEKSIVRPAFSYYGKLFISDTAIAAIVRHVANDDPALTGVGQISIKNSNEPEKGISISVDISVKYGMFILDAAKKVQHHIKNMVELMTDMLVREVSITVKRVGV